VFCVGVAQNERVTDYCLTLHPGFGAVVVGTLYALVDGAGTGRGFRHAERPRRKVEAGGNTNAPG
jgi:hypothetical protein